MALTPLLLRVYDQALRIKESLKLAKDVERQLAETSDDGNGNHEGMAR